MSSIANIIPPGGPPPPPPPNAAPGVAPDEPNEDDIPMTPPPERAPNRISFPDDPRKPGGEKVEMEVLHRDRWPTPPHVAPAVGCSGGLGVLILGE